MIRGSWRFKICITAATFLVTVAVSLSTMSAKAQPANAAPKPVKLDMKAMTKIAGRTGFTIVRELVNRERIEIPPSSLPPEERIETVEKALRRYEFTRNAYSGFSTGTKVTQIAVGGTIAAAIASGGTAVPLILIGGMSELSLDLTNRKVEARGRENSGRILAALADDLVAASGATDIGALMSNRELLKKTLTTSDAFLKDIKDRANASGDPKLVEIAVEAIANRAAEMDEATLLEISKTSGDVAKLKDDFTEFTVEVNASNGRIEKALVEHEKQLGELTEGMAKLDDAVGELDGKVDKLGRNQDLIADFMFSGLGPAEKVRALKQGLIDNRIVCPSGALDCDPEKIKASMIIRYQAEADVKESVSKAGEVLKGINDIQNIANNLGIPLGHDGQKAINLASAALKGYANFMSGDYLGALSSITSIFGRKPKDPDAERFKIMMAFLQQQFEQVNRKLDAILENQKTILDAITAVSKQLADVYVQLDGRLEQAEYGQQVISRNLKRLIWRPWKNCFSVYYQALNPQFDGQLAPPHVDVRSLKFKSFEDLVAVVDASAVEARACMNLVKTELDNVSSTTGLGNFLDVQAALDPSSLASDSTIDPATLKDANDFRSAERKYRDNVVGPVDRIQAAYAHRHGLAPETLFSLLAVDTPTVAVLGVQQTRVAEGFQYECGPGPDSLEAVEGLVCVNGVNRAQLALNLSHAVLDSRILLDVIDWMTIVSRLGELYNPNTEEFATSIAGLTSLPEYNTGWALTRRLTDVVALALASRGRINGHLTSLAVAEDIVAGRETLDHRNALRFNPYLAENVATTLLHMMRGSWTLNEERAGPSFESRYAQALLYARNGRANDAQTQFDPLHALFGRKFQFAVDSNGKVVLRLIIDDAPTDLPLPAPAQLAEGRLVYPPDYLILQQRKQRLIDRRMDYELASDPLVAEAVLAH